ncbi:MAG: hypothetical protein EXS25_06380 [Pedosphaera sp.]|nr:hypothetical protein [Pedosphaera sp.]
MKNPLKSLTILSMVGAFTSLAQTFPIKDGTLFTTVKGPNIYGYGTGTSSQQSINGHKGREFGDDITLDSNKYIFTSVEFDFFAGNAGGTYVFSMYAMDGALSSANKKTPGTSLFEFTGSISKGNNNVTQGYISTPGDVFTLPNHFAYTIKFAGNTDVGMYIASSVDNGTRNDGQNFAYPGSSFSDFLVKTGTGSGEWDTRAVADGAGGFGVTFKAGFVPEPTTVALGVLGAVVLIGSTLRRNRR